MAESSAMGGGKSKQQAQPAPAQGPHHARGGSLSAAGRASKVGGSSTDPPAQTPAQPASEETLLACLPAAKSHDVETRHKAPVQYDINGADAAEVSRETSGLRRESSLSSEAVTSPSPARRSVTTQLPKTAQMHLLHKIKSDNNRSQGRETDADKLFREGELALTDIMKGRHQQVQKFQQDGIDGLIAELKKLKSMIGNSSGQATTQLLRYAWRACIRVCVVGMLRRARGYLRACACTYALVQWQCVYIDVSQLHAVEQHVIDVARCQRMYGSPERMLSH